MRSSWNMSLNSFLRFLILDCYETPNDFETIPPHSLKMASLRVQVNVKRQSWKNRRAATNQELLRRSPADAIGNQSPSCHQHSCNKRRTHSWVFVSEDKLHISIYIYIYICVCVCVCVCVYPTPLLGEGSKTRSILKGI